MRDFKELLIWKTGMVIASEVYKAASQQQEWAPVDTIEAHLLLTNEEQRMLTSFINKLST
jgi:hypothetical protein